MSELSSAFIRIRPNMSGFASEMRAGLKSAFTDAESVLTSTSGQAKKLAESFDQVAASAKAGFTGIAASTDPVMASLSELQAKAEQNVAAFVGQKTELESLVSAYGDMAAAAVKGSDTAIAAARLQQDAEQQLAAKFTQVGAAAEKSAAVQTAAMKKSAGEAETLKGALSKVGGVLGIAFGADIAVKTIKELVSSAASVQKSSEAITFGFGQAGKAVIDFNDTAAAKLGISATTGEAAAAKFSILFHNMGLGQEQSAQMTVGLEKLAGSLAMIRGIDPSQALQSLSMAMLGNMRSLKQLGISYTQQQIAQEAVRLGIVRGITTSQAQAAADTKLAIAKARLAADETKYGANTTQVAAAQIALKAAQDKASAAVAKAAGALSPAQKAQAIYALSTQNLNQYMEQAQRHAGDLANVQRRLTAEWSNAKEALGTSLMPMFDKVSTSIANYIDKETKTGALQRNINAVVKDAGAIFGTLSTVLRTGWSIFQTVSGWIGGTTQALKVLTAAVIVFKAQAMIQAVLSRLAAIGTTVEESAGQTTAALATVQQSAAVTVADVEKIGTAAQGAGEQMQIFGSEVAATMEEANGQVALFATGLSTKVEAAAVEGAASVEASMGSSGISGAIAGAKTELSGFASSLASISGAIIPITIALSMVPTNKGGQSVLGNMGGFWAALGKAPLIGGVATQAAALGNDIRGWLGEGKIPTWTAAQADAARAAARSAVAGNSSQFISVAGGAQLNTKAQAIKFAMAMAQAQGLDEAMFLRQINQESGFNPNARSGAGATGIAQFMPGTAKGLGVNALNPGSSLAGAAVLMKRLQNQYGGNLADALAAYNAGPRTVNAYLAGRGSLPKETIDYVNSIMGAASPFRGGSGTVTGGPNAASTAAAAAAAAQAAGLHVGTAAKKPMTAAQLDKAQASMEETYRKLKAKADELGPELTSTVKRQMDATSKAITSVANASDVAKAKSDLTKFRDTVTAAMAELRRITSQTKVFDGLQAQIKKLGPDVTPEIKKQMKTIQSEIGKVVTPEQILQFDQQVARLKSEVSKQLTAIKATISAQKSSFQSMWGELASGIDTAFDDATQKAIKNMQVTVSSAAGSFLFGGSITQTPAEQQLAALQSSHTQAQDAKALADAENALADATAKYNALVDPAENSKAVRDAAQAVADYTAKVQIASDALAAMQASNATPDKVLAASTGLSNLQNQLQNAQDAYAAILSPSSDTVDNAKTAVLNAQQQLADAQFNDKSQQLQDQATLQRTAADKQLADAQTAYQQQRALLKQQLDQRVADIETGMLNGNISTHDGLAQMTAILADPKFGLAAATSGVVISGNLYSGLAAGMKPVFDLVNELISGMQEVGLLGNAHKLTMPSVSSLDVSANSALAKFLSGDSALLASILAEIKSQTPAVQKTAENTDPENHTPLAGANTPPNGDSVNSVVLSAVR